MKKSIFLILSFILISSSLKAQNVHNLDTHHKNAIIDTILTCFKINYVYPETVISLKDSITQRNRKGEYSKYFDLENFLAKLTSDIREITSDKHISIVYIENTDYKSRQNKHSLLSDQLNEKKRKNFNFRKVEWLPGNVGYLRFDIFEDPQYAGETAASAINFISNCNAIIIDLRYNYGGEQQMVRYLASYFFTEPTLLNSLYFTKQDSVVQSWTDSYIPSKKLIDKYIYILTSSNTASGAEAFTYLLKNYKIATIIGENTRGAAHWAEYFYFPAQKIEIKIPVARPINPVTKTNWEKIGIKPDIEIPEYKALDQAYILALEQLIQTNSDKSKLHELEWYKMIAVERFKNETISETELYDYAGEYEELRFLVKDNTLYWHQGKNEEFVLIPLSRDLFTFDDSDDYVVKFIRNKKGIISGYQLLIKGRDENTIHDKIEDTE